VRHYELVRISLFLAQRCACLDPLFRVLDGALHGFAAASKTERGDHQACVAEHPLRLREPLPLDATEQLISRYVDVVEHHCSRVAVANAVFVLGFTVTEAFGAGFDQENLHC
jgi:hypothetical protein